MRRRPTLSLFRCVSSRGFSSTAARNPPPRFAVLSKVEGLRRWFDHRDNPLEFERYLKGRQRRKEFVHLVLSYRDRIESVYQGPYTLAHKRKMKSELLKGLRQAYRQLKISWGGYTGYDEWFEHPLNNAKITTVSTYYDFLPAFNEIIASCNGNLDLFFERCRRLAELPQKQRHRDLKRIQSGSGI